MSERELPQQSPSTRYYCPYCDVRPDGYAYPRGARHHMELKHPVEYAELMVRWGDENRINAFIKNAFIRTAYDAPRGERGLHLEVQLPPAETSVAGKTVEASLGVAGPGMAPGGETNLGVEKETASSEAVFTPLKPNPGELDLAVDMLEIMGTQEAMREALNQAIEQLNVHSQSLSEIMGGKPGTAVTVPSVAPVWNLDEIPGWLRDPLVKFMGDIGAAARSLAGGAPADDDYGKMIGDELKRREKERMASRAKLIVDTIYSDEELYSKPKDPPKPEDVKKLG